jgi:hypothetical protein
MVTVIVSHECKDFSEWRKAFDAHEEVRAKAGFKISGVYQCVEDSNYVVLLGEAPDAETIASFMANPELKERMEQAGVVGKPEVTVLKKA